MMGMAMPTTSCMLRLGNVRHRLERERFRASISPNVESARTRELKMDSTADGKTKVELPEPAPPAAPISVPPTVITVSIAVTVTTYEVTIT